MNYLLIFISLLFFSCGKKNSIQKIENSNHLDSQAFLTVEYNGGISSLRKKILNAFVEEKNPKSKFKREIEHHEELVGLIMGKNELESYEENERNMAKIIVSYPEYSEIYFLPEYISLDLIVQKLGLKKEAGRRFKWVHTDALTTYSGGVFYLASVSLSDIVYNDQFFYEEILDLKDQFLKKEIKILPGKSVEVIIEHQLFNQEEITDIFQGRASSCSNDMREAGMCTPCSYKRKVPGEKYILVPSLPAKELNLAIKYGDKISSLKELNFQEITTNKINVNLIDPDFEKMNVMNIEFYLAEVPSIVKKTEGFEYADRCINRNEEGKISLQQKIEARVQLKVKGRGFLGLKNIL